MTDLSSRFVQALFSAFALHRYQKRKGSDTPYFAHLMGVSAIVLEYGGTEDQAIAALLHDAVEDQGGKDTLDKIRTEFGDAVAAIVKDCSDTDTSPKPPWFERKKKYLAHLPGTREEAWLVSLADKYYNASTIWWELQQPEKDVWERFNAEKMDVLWYYCKLVEAYQGMHGDEYFTLLTFELEKLVNRIVKMAGEGNTCTEIMTRHGKVESSHFP